MMVKKEAKKLKKREIYDRNQEGKDDDVMLILLKE